MEFSNRGATRALLATVSLVALLGGGREAVAQVSNEELLRKLEAMEQRIKFLEGQLEQRPATPAPAAAAPAPAAAPVAAAPVRVPRITAQVAPSPAAPTANSPAGAPQPSSRDKAIFGIMDSPIDGLRFGAYGELKYGTRQNPDANGQWQSGFDAARLVLLPSYAITDNIIFNAEIEFEHGGIAVDADDKLSGSVDVEQAYIDFKYRDYLNFRAPGIDLVPIGYINLHHEPTLFYSVDRPELSNGLIPTTFRAPAASIYGNITPSLSYQFQISQSIEDFGDSDSARGDSHTAPAGPFTAGIDGKNGLALSRPPVGDFKQLNNDLAYTLRLAYTPGFVPGLAGSTSVYYTPNTTPRGSHDDSGNELGHSSMTLLDSELRYRPPESGLELRAEYAHAFFGKPQNLRANNDSDPTNNVGTDMWGISGEIAYHFKLGDDWEAVPFYRYTYQDLQSGGFVGTDANTPTGAGKRQFHTVGAAFFPTPKLVLKLNYQSVVGREPGGARSDSVLGGVGFFF